MAGRLGKQQWIDAALRTLAGHGVDAVRVESLAKALGVTKGSFYWHFKNRSALLAAVLAAWEARATGDIIFTLEAGGGDAQSRLRSLGEKVFSSDGRLDRQIRAWAASDPLARAAQDHVDLRRTRYVESLFAEMGFSQSEAAARAALLYLALIGHFAMEARARPTREQLDLMVGLLLPNDSRRG